MGEENYKKKKKKKKTDARRQYFVQSRDEGLLEQPTELLALDTAVQLRV
jgi:hypothetical protein